MTRKIIWIFNFYLRAKEALLHQMKAILYQQFMRTLYMGTFVLLRHYWCFLPFGLLLELMGQ